MLIFALKVFPLLTAFFFSSPKEDTSLILQEQQTITALEIKLKKQILVGLENQSQIFKVINSV